MPTDEPEYQKAIEDFRMLFGQFLFSRSADNTISHEAFNTIFNGSNAIAAALSEDRKLAFRNDDLTD